MPAKSGIGIYDKLGVRPVINAWGVATELGGWTLTPEATKAMSEANRSQVEMQELMDLLYLLAITMWLDLALQEIILQLVLAHFLLLSIRVMDLPV